MAKRKPDIIEKAIDDIDAMNNCPGHEWVGPIEKVEFRDFTDYQVRCKHCPLAKGFGTEAAAQEAIDD